MNHAHDANHTISNRNATRYKKPSAYGFTSFLMFSLSNFISCV